MTEVRAQGFSDRGTKNESPTSPQGVTLTVDSFKKELTSEASELFHYSGWPLKFTLVTAKGEFPFVYTNSRKDREGELQYKLYETTIWKPDGSAEVWTLTVFND